MSRLICNSIVWGFVIATLTSCAERPEPAEIRASSEAATPAASEAPATPPFMPVATVLELMESIIAHSAEVYWGSVSIIVDENGITENFPETDEEWEEVWAAAIGIAESGNLLMMTPRALDNDAWMEMSAALVRVGVDAAAAAQAKDAERVLAMGEQVYNVCLACHARYIPETQE
jgi:hypothetical protein